jgi:uncharacterized protein YraI
MKIRALTVGAVSAALFAIPTIAEASWGHATGSVNMRTCASTTCPKIGVVPAGAQVWIGGQQGSWLMVNFGGRDGFVHGNYIAGGGYAVAPPPPMYAPPFYGPQVGFSIGFGAPPRSGYWKKPWWDNRHNAWYDGRRWYRDGRWYNDPSGFSIGFSFGN